MYVYLCMCVYLVKTGEIQVTSLKGELTSAKEEEGHMRVKEEGVSDWSAVGCDGAWRGGAVWGGAREVMRG